MNQEENHALSETLKEKKLQKWLPHLLVFCIFCLALGLRVGYVRTLEIDTPIRDDALKYYKLAYNLAENGVYSQAQNLPFTPETAITPGYPLFLAAILALSSDVVVFYNTTLLLQAILSTVTVILVYCIFWRHLPWFLCVLGTFLVAVSPHLIIYSGYLLTETLFTFLLILGIFFYIIGISKNSIAGQMSAGIVLGIASLTRPALLFSAWPLSVFLAVLRE